MFWWVWITFKDENVVTLALSLTFQLMHFRSISSDESNPSGNMRSNEQNPYGKMCIDKLNPSRKTWPSWFQKHDGSRNDGSSDDISNNESNPTGKMCMSWLLYAQQPMKMRVFQFFIYNGLNTSKNESTISLYYLQWINWDTVDVVINNRQMYQRTKNMWYQLKGTEPDDPYQLSPLNE